MTTLPHLARLDAPPVRGGSGTDPAGTVAEDAARTGRVERGLSGFLHSSIGLRIVLVNLTVLVALIGAVLFLFPFRDLLVEQRHAGLMTEARLTARLVEAASAQDDLAAVESLRAVPRGPGAAVYIYDPDGNLIGGSAGVVPEAQDDSVLTDGPRRAGEPKAWLTGSAGRLPEMTVAALARSLVDAPRTDAIATGRSRDPESGDTILAVAVPVRAVNGTGDVVVLTAAVTQGLGIPGDLRLLLILAGSILGSVAVSLFLATSITRPLAALASAAEQGRDRHARRMTRGRVRIPDLAERSDEVGRLSKAMRGMVAALYDRIDANEQFAADVAHEIKNPLASLRAAVGTLRLSHRDDQRDRLLDVVDHDVRRLDRLVSDISNASRLDSDLVREESLRFNLLRTLTNLGEHLALQASETGVAFITDLPPEPILIDGLEERLAQVFVNLITNAISFCDEGDAIRLWARRRENRVLIVVEDTGPGIPEAALGKVFDRFYSERPEQDFGNHSGLGLAISKQIVEAHGGVIWAENIRPTQADITSEPLGARFVVGLPV